MAEVVLLTKEDCEFCDQAKDVLARLRPEYALDVREVALETDEGRRLAASAGLPFPPVVFLNGEPAFYGRLSERKLRKLLSAA